MTASTSQPEVSTSVDFRLAETAILRTVLYSDVFDYPLRVQEIHHYLIGQVMTLGQVRQTLEQSSWLMERLVRAGEYYAVTDRAHLAEQRESRRYASAHLWGQALRYARTIGHLPWVRMVSVTGALAMDNSDADDDIDYLIVTAPGRVWSTRALCILIVRLARANGVGLCPNYVLAETALVEQRRDLFTAHEMIQMTPVVGHGLYRTMRALNSWVDRYLPNANGPYRPAPDLRPHPVIGRAQRCLEAILNNRFVDRVEAWERRRKQARFALQSQHPGASAVLDSEHVKGHFNDYGGPALRAYEERVARFIG